jgi:hypothetical protein
MNETIDLTKREIENEIHLRKKGKRGEWNISTGTLVKLYFMKTMNLPYGISRSVKSGED